MITRRGKNQATVFARRRLGVLCALLVFCVPVVPSLAHDPGLSTIDLYVDKAKLVAHLTVTCSDLAGLVELDGNGDGLISEEEFTAAQSRLQKIARDALEVRIDDQPVSPENVALTRDGSDEIQFRLQFPRPPGAHLSVHSALLARLAHGHRQHVSLSNHRNTAATTRMFDANNNRLEITL